MKPTHCEHPYEHLRVVEEHVEMWYKIDQIDPDGTIVIDTNTASPSGPDKYRLQCLQCGCTSTPTRLDWI